MAVLTLLDGFPRSVILWAAVSTFTLSAVGVFAWAKSQALNSPKHKLTFEHLEWIADPVKGVTPMQIHYLQRTHPARAAG
jgi:hypothetical protein